MFRVTKGVFIAAMLLYVSLMTVVKQSVILLLIFIAAHFVILKITPAFKRCENLAMFVIVAFSSIPINIYLFQMLNYRLGLFNSNFVVNFVRGSFYYLMLLSLEEIVMGIITRFLWRKQYKMVD